MALLQTTDSGRYSHNQEKTHNNTVIYNKNGMPPRGIVAKILSQFLLEKIAAVSPTALLSGDVAKKNYALRLANFSL